MPLPGTEQVAVRVTWDTDTDDSGTKDIGDKYITTVYIPAELYYQWAEHYEGTPVEDWLSDTFGWLVKSWEVASEND